MLGGAGKSRAGQSPGSYLSVESCQGAPDARKNRPAALLRIQKRSDDFPGFLVRHHRDDLEGHAETLAVQDPILQQPRVVAFHQLKAAVEIGFDPTPDITQSFGKFDALVAHALVDRDRVTVLEALDHHEQHRQPLIDRRRAALFRTLRPSSLVAWGLSPKPAQPLCRNT